MGGKKKKGGGKKGKKGKAGGEFALSMDETNAVLEVEKTALQARIIEENMDANKSKAAENEKRFREL